MLIMLVDDNEISIELQRLMLESYGLVVQTAQSGAKAIELARQNDYFMIFMDVRMPVMDGFATAKRIREFNTTVPIIALSADKISPEDPQFVDSGMNGALIKPMRLSQLKDTLSRYVALNNSDAFAWSKRTDALFDSEELVSFLGDEKAVMRILQQFLNLHSHDCDILRERIEAGNFRSARELTNDIVGISGNLFCRRLYEAAKRLSLELNRGQSKSFNSFSGVWKLTIRKLSECCNQLAAKYKPTEDNTAVWSTVWSDFCTLSREFDVAAADIFKDNIKNFSAHMIDSEFEELKKAVNCYNFLWIIENIGGFHVSGLVG